MNNRKCKDFRNSSLFRHSSSPDDISWTYQGAKKGGLLDDFWPDCVALIKGCQTISPLTHPRS